MEIAYIGWVSGWVLGWLALTVVLLIIEGVTVNLVTIWFAIGAAAALLASLLGGGPLVQVAVFILVSFVALALTKPLVDRTRKTTPKVPTNGDRNIGRVGTVLVAIAPGQPGRVRLDGVDWAARSADGSSLQAGALCRVTGNESVTLLVVAEPAPAHT